MYALLAPPVQHFRYILKARKKNMEHNRAFVLAIIDRMKTVLDAKSDKQVADELGIARSTFGVWKKRGSIPYQKCIDLALQNNISLDWLVLGRGRPELSASEVAPEVDKPYIELGEYDASHMCTSDTGYREWFASPEWMAQEGLDGSTTIVVRAAGDAMAPTIGDGNLVIIDTRKKDKDGVYLLRSGDSVRFRRVQHLSDGSVRLLCDNPAYEAEMVSATAAVDLRVIGYCHVVIAPLR